MRLPQPLPETSGTFQVPEGTSSASASATFQTCPAVIGLKDLWSPPEAGNAFGNSLEPSGPSGVPPRWGLLLQAERAWGRMPGV